MGKGRIIVTFLVVVFKNVERLVEVSVFGIKQQRKKRETNSSRI